MKQKVTESVTVFLNLSPPPNGCLGLPMAGYMVLLECHLSFSLINLQVVVRSSL